MRHALCSMPVFPTFSPSFFPSFPTSVLSPMRYALCALPVFPTFSPSHLLFFRSFPPSFFPLPHSDFPLQIIPTSHSLTFSSRQEPPKAIGKCLFSLLSACFRGGATRSLPYLSCSLAPHRTGQAAFPHTAPRFVIQYASALRHGSRSLRILGFGHLTQAKAWLKLAQVYALRWLLRLSHLNNIRVVR